MSEVESQNQGPRRVDETAAPASVAARLDAVLEGSAEAISWLYDTFAPGLLRRLRGRYAYPGGFDPEDLLHDAFVFYLQRGGKVLADFASRHPPYRQTEAALERHLWDLACGLASNRRRSARRAEFVPISGERRSPEPGAERETLDRDLLLRLDECLRKGNARIYLYFNLRYARGHAPAEIAEATGWSKKATFKLKQKMSNAVRRCAEWLGLTSA